MVRGVIPRSEAMSWCLRPRWASRMIGSRSRSLRRMLRGRSCKARFSERKGTPLFDARLPADKVGSVLEHVAEGCGVRQTGRLCRVAPNTVARYSRIAGEHAKAAHDELVELSP